tara:strand:- start:262 stop:474 length:213 start_codon:yes stop_codon:yes gene_type:complete
MRLQRDIAVLKFFSSFTMQTIFGFFEPLNSFKLTKFELFFAEKNVNLKKDKILNQKFLLTTKLSKITFSN